MKRWAGALVCWLALAGSAAAEVQAPPGFSVRVYVTGDGFETGGTRGVRGVPSVSTLALDPAGVMYLARNARRYSGGETEDVWPIYRIPPGGTTLTPAAEARFFYGPPLRNPQVAAVRGEREVLVTTFDRERRIGVLYSVVNARAELLAGGTPAGGAPPLLRQPEGVAVDPAGLLYVADREQGVVIRLDGHGRVLDPQWIGVKRPRLLAVHAGGGVWIGADAEVTAPWQQGPGEIWHVSADGAPRLVLRGPLAQGIAVSPGGNLFVSDRHAGEIFAVTPEGRRLDFARFTDGDAPRGVAFAPVTPETRRAGIAGDLFVITINRGVYAMNEVVRISGDFDALVRERLGGAR